MTTAQTTPMMAQWHSCKESAPNCILFFRLGDFYEAFYDDAKLISKELDLTLTKRQDIPMAGVPHHICETYIDRLVAKGYRVAIAEQVEDPKQTKGIVKRKVVRTVTPGTVINSSLLTDKEKSYLATIVPLNKTYSLALLEITTADFKVHEFENKKQLFDELARTRPKELILPKKYKELAKELPKSQRPTCHYLDDYQFDHKSTLDFLLNHFQLHSLEGFGIKGMIGCINAAGALLAYVRNDLNLPIDHIRSLKPHTDTDTMLIDSHTQVSLELITPLHHGQKEATLLSLLDETKTPMGGRLLRDWILHPLLLPEKIALRQDAISAFQNDFSTFIKLRGTLDPVRDLERLIMRIETGFASPRDCISLANSLEKVPELSAFLCTFNAQLLSEKLIDPTPIVQTIQSAIVDEPPLRLSDGGSFRKGYNPKLDQLLDIKKDSKTWLLNYQVHLRQKYDIKNLKVGYTRAFGYYIEISKANLSKVPEELIRRQTLVNAERFITNELKEFEYKILSADEKISALESELFQELRENISSHAPQIRQLATQIAQIDALSSLTKVAIEREYTRPKIDTSTAYNIKDSRHPVIEKVQLDPFIPNDIDLDNEKNQLAIITGPNMAGKSTYIRQAALLAIMAQIGSFLPAKSAHIGIIDKIFTRIGASDDLTKGQSTFMIEMLETANILNNCTDRSLVILDEIGRGTSTYDGISIAWAVAKYLLTTSGKKAKTLFATHYFEMTELADKYSSAFNLNVVVEETDDEVIFLRKIKPGSADKSYGIHVALLAGLPTTAIRDAKQKLHQLENVSPPKKAPQLDLFSLKETPPSPILTELEKLDPNTLTPLQALQLLNEWKKKND